MAEPGPSRTNPNSRLDIEVVRHAETSDGLPVSDALLSRAANAAFDAAAPGRHGPYEITIVLTDDNEMRELNRIWRDKDSSTNVLSFPAGEPLDTDNDEPMPLGDVVLAAETVLAEAGQQEVSVADHVSHLVVHGVLHLLGYDHERDEDAETMESLETKILASLCIADPYAESGNAALVELTR